MRRRTRTAACTLALAAALLGPTGLAACGGRTDGGNPGNPAGDTSTSTSTTAPVVGAP